MMKETASVRKGPWTEDDTHTVKPQMLQLRDFRPFKTSDEYLWAMKEDLSEWLTILYPHINITSQTFMESLETGITLCKHANNVTRSCQEWIEQGKKLPKCWGKEWKHPSGEVTFNSNARPETFFARDNVHNFITWCRKLGIFECLLFESDDLIMRKNEKSVVLCLLEVARIGSNFGMATPMLVQFEKEIDRDIAKDTGVDLGSSGEEEESLLEYGPVQQIITNDLRSLHERVRELVERCSCPTQFPMIRVAEGKYKIGNTKVMIYVRILRNHVMVRVGGGWDTLAHYLDKHDPCRCSTSHRAAIASRLIIKNDGPSPRMRVEYNRGDLSLDSHVNPHHGPSFAAKKPTDLSDSGSEISDEGYKTSEHSGNGSKDLTLNGQVRRGSMTRTLSISTDEDRPESRSTDEDVILTPPRKVQGVLKSQSANRVPTDFYKTSAYDRGKYDSAVSARKRYVPVDSSSTKQQPTPKHPPSVLATSRFPAQTRSLSASGTAEFYGRNIPSGNGLSRATKRFVPGQRNGVQTATPLQRNVNDKNTWNGTGSRVRTNLFQSGLFQHKRQISDLGVRNQDGTGDSSLVMPDLASCIKQALELDSDAAKISHIEGVIRQYEMKRRDSDHESASLPCFTPIQPTINKRKDNGTSKIPKPNFY